jgi:PIN domain nuclease of toxin-antitoxin system
MDEPRLLLDTHIWFRLATGNDQQLGPALIDKLERTARTAPLLISIISV